MKGAELIVKERERQISVEGYTKESDLQYRNGELIAAARGYAGYAQDTLAFERARINEPTRALFPRDWPWEKKYFKGDDKNPIKDLIKAGALIAAEIDRILNSGEFPELKKIYCPQTVLTFLKLKKLKIA